MEEKIAAGEYASKSELVNATIKYERDKEAAKTELLALLDDAETSGISSRSPRQIREELIGIHKRRA